MFAAFFGLLLCVEAAADAAHFTVKATSSAADAKATFMIISGITSGAEMCVVAEGGAVDVPASLAERVASRGTIAPGEVDGASALLEPCLEAVAAGDGRELWQFEAAGAIQSAVGKKCLQARTGVQRLPPKRTPGSRGQRVPLSVQPRFVMGADGRGPA